MSQNVDAIFEQGAFRVLGEIGTSLSEGQRVRLTIDTATDESAADLLELAAQTYDGLSDAEVEEIEQIALDRRSFFTDRAGGR